MTIEKIVEALETATRRINPCALFVLQKEIEPCKFKIFKRFTYTLWYIDKNRDKKFKVLTLSKTERVTSAEEEKAVVNNLETYLTTYLFRFVREEEYELILGGSYDGNELVLDPALG